MYNRGAQLVGALPDLQRSRICAGSAAGADHAGKVAEVVFGPNPSDEAVELSKVIVQASEFVHDRDTKRQRIEDYEALMPREVADVQQQIVELAEAAVVNLREKVKTVERAFEIVCEKATALTNACSKLESQFDSLSNAQFHIDKYQKLLLTIHEQRPKLLERKSSLETELGKKFESRQKFIANCRADFVPDAVLKEVMGNELSNDWGAEAKVREASLAVLRVVEVVFVQVATKLAGSRDLSDYVLVDENVFAVITELFGDEA
jgi:hypothetical protein